MLFDQRVQGIATKPPASMRITVSLPSKSPEFTPIERGVYFRPLVSDQSSLQCRENTLGPSRLPSSRPLREPCAKFGGF
jgi:hypothetical protein